MPTYLIAYEDELTRRIEKGGLQEDVDRAIKSYNHFHRSEFDSWLTDATLACGHCGAPAAKDRVEPLDEIACDVHRPSKENA